MKTKNVELYKALCAFVDGRPEPARRLGLKVKGYGDAWRALELASRQMTREERARIIAEGRAQA